MSATKLFTEANAGVHTDGHDFPPPRLLFAETHAKGLISDKLGLGGGI
jgi:hypothetical protein